MTEPGPIDDDLREAATALSGEWKPEWDAPARLDPGFLRAYVDFARVPHEAGHLDPKSREFVYIAVAAASSEIYLPGLRHHVRAALRAGATIGEISEVLQLTCALGVHALTDGVSVLAEILEEQGRRAETAALTERQERLKAGFIEGRGYWNPIWQDLLELDQDILEAYTAFSAYPWRTGTLTPKMREFVYVAFDVSATHLYLQGLKLHIENAMRYGATTEEVLEVMEIATLFGFNSYEVGAEILLEEAEAARAERGGASAGDPR